MEILQASSHNWVVPELPSYHNSLYNTITYILSTGSGTGSAFDLFENIKFSPNDENKEQ